MPWSVRAQARVDNPSSMGWQGLALPSVPGARVWGLRYTPDTYIPSSWSRIGFVSTAVFMGSTRLTGPTINMPGVTAEPNDLLSVLDYSVFTARLGLGDVIEAYLVYYRMVPYCPVGLMTLEVFT